MKDLCTITMDNVMESSEEFVTVFAAPDGEIAMYCNADTLTLGFAAAIIMEAYTKSLDQCTIKDRKEIMEIINKGMEERALS